KNMTTVSENIEEIFVDFVRSFVEKDKQERILTFFKNKKNWSKIINEFHTSGIFNKKSLLEISPAEQYSNEIFLRLNKMGVTERCVSLIDYLNNEPYNFHLKEKLSASVGFLTETIIY